MKNAICSRPFENSLKMIVTAGTLMLFVNCPALAQTGASSQVKAPQTTRALSSFMQNLEQQLSSLTGSAQPREQPEFMPTTHFTIAPRKSVQHVNRTVSVPKKAKKPLTHLPLPALVPNPLANAEEVDVQQKVNQNVRAFQSAIKDEDHLSVQIAQLSQQNPASNANKIATIKKQLNNDVAVERQVRANIDGWNNYLVSYEQYLYSINQTDQSNYATTGGGSSNDTTSSSDNHFADPIDPLQQMQIDNYNQQQQAQMDAQRDAQEQQAQQQARDRAQAQEQDQQQQADQQADQQARQQAQQQADQLAQQQAQQQQQQQQADRQAQQQADQQAQQQQADRQAQQQADQQAQQQAQQQQADQQAQQQQAQQQQMQQQADQQMQQMQALMQPI